VVSATIIHARCVGYIGGMPAYCHPAAYDAFAREMPHVDTTRGLFRAAFAIALHEHPDANLEQAESTLKQLAETVNGRVRSPDPRARLAHLHDVLFDVVGFTGNVDDYYNPANSYLPDVLATHRGLPITLVLIYKFVAEEVGLVVRGINSPGHFLAAVQCPEPGQSRAVGNWMYVDPFYGGGLLSEGDVYRRISEATGRDDPPSPAWLAPATHRQWLARTLHNLQAVFAHTGRERDLYAMQELQNLLE
jgi:regulator of sirC expression with transglutaminase-like and TPR domain